MREIIGLIQKQAAQMDELANLLQELKECLQKNSSGQGVRDLVKEMEQQMGLLSRMEREQASFLALHGSGNMMDFVQAQPDSEERDVALRLLFQIEDMAWDVRQGIEVSRALLQRSFDFAAYHINVLSQTMASDTYGPPGGAAVEAARGRKIFDTNV